ncbi:hypothetical protein D3C72_809390 [compost metagenome]
MKKYYKSLPLNPKVYLFGSAILASLNVTAQCVAPSVGCAGNDRTNAYLHSTTPGTIEYDNVVSLFHSTFARQADGRVLVWGEKIGSTGGNVLSPQEINASNYPGLTGEILKFAGGSEINTSSQHFVLTTNGLYFWGTDNWGIGTGTSFQKLTIDGQANGLPSGVAPADVKMLFGTNRMLGLVTCNGSVYTLVAASDAATASAYGDGSAYSAANNAVWHRVKTNSTTNLNNVVAIRGNGRMNFFALTTTGALYTWGQSTYLGDDNTYAVRNYASVMDIPAGITPKMVGMTAANAVNTSTYYLLATNGNLYALGYNAQKQAGDFTTTAREQWVQVKKSSAAGDYLANVVWISPNEHDLGYTNTGAINAITADTVLYAWGGNNRQMLGGGTANASIDPSTNLGGLTAGDKIIAVETGGHTTMSIRKCSSFFGYVGHKTGGSMGDGTSTDADIPNYSFSTSQMDVCGASTEAATLFPVVNATVGNTYNMTASPSGGNFSIISGPATINATTGAVTITGAGTIDVGYQVTAGDCPSSTQITFSASVPTPISLESFTLNRAKNAVVLDWITAKEMNNKGFEIQSSTNGNDWTTIGFTGSLAPNGSSNAKLYYSFTDVNPVTGKNYYRLKQIDFDGIFDFSPVRQISFGKEGMITIFPNPAQNNVHIDGLTKNDRVRIYDPSGRVVFDYQASSYSADIDIHNFQKGIYFVEIITESGNKIHDRLVKQ